MSRTSGTVLFDISSLLWLMLLGEQQHPQNVAEATNTEHFLSSYLRKFELIKDIINQNI